jgi:hypothetical protein
MLNCSAPTSVVDEHATPGAMPGPMAGGRERTPAAAGLIRLLRAYDYSRAKGTA